MANTTANKAAAAPAKAAAKAAPAPKAAATPMHAPLFTYAPYKAGTNGKAGNGWPAKSATGYSVRAYCAQVAQRLAKAQPKGFTAAQFASALAAGHAAGVKAGFKQPSSGWGTAKQPNSNAMAHANWFTGAKQAWLPKV